MTISYDLLSKTTVDGKKFASRNNKKNSYSDFKKVKKIVLKPSRNVIYLNQALERNQVYAEPDSFQQVADYIIQRCPKATVVK